MRLGHPAHAFFSYVDGLTGTPFVCLLGTRQANGTVAFEAFDARKVDIDALIIGSWSPAGGLLVIDGEISATVDEVSVTGRYLVIERDGSATIEEDGSRHLEENETLITPRFLEGAPAGSRMALLKEATDDDEEGVETMIARDDAELGRPFSTL